MVVVRTDPGDKTEANPTTRGTELYTGSGGLTRASFLEGLERLSGVFFEDFGQCGSKATGVFARKDKRRAEFDDVAMRAVRAGENSLLTEAVDDIVGLAGGRSSGDEVRDEVDTEE